MTKNLMTALADTADASKSFLVPTDTFHLYEYDREVDSKSHCCQVIKQPFQEVECPVNSNKHGHRNKLHRQFL